MSKARDLGDLAGALNGNTNWHEGNDGTGSGLDADLLDGQQGSYYYLASNPDGFLSGIVSTNNGGTGLNTIGTANQFLGVNSGGTALEYKTIQTDSTLGTLTQSFTPNQQATITLSSAVTAGAPVVSVTKEVPQTGVTNNFWDVSASNYTFENTAYATTLSFFDFSITNATFVDSFSVASQELTPTGIAFNTNGTKMFIVGQSGDDVNEYTLSTGFDVSTASYSQNFSVALQDTEPTGIAFNTNGTKMFIVGSAGDAVYEYTLSTGFDVSTASFVDSFSVASQEALPRGIAFNTNGTKMFIVGASGDDVNEYTLSIGFDVSTASYSQNFSVAAQEANPEDIAFNTDGTKMFIVGSNGDEVNEYTLSTGFDVSTASYVQNFSVAAQEPSPTGIAFNTDGTKMFIIGQSGDDVNEYTLSVPFSGKVTLGTGSFVSADVGKTIYLNNGTLVLTSTDGVISTVTEPTSKATAASGDWSMYALVYDSGTDVLKVSGNGSSIVTGYQPAFSSRIDTTYWTDINSITATNALGDGAVYYALSDDGRTTWSVQNDNGTVRDIVRNNAGTWQYNSNNTFGSQTWTNSSVNTEVAALKQAMEAALSGFIDTFDVSTASYVQNFSVASQETGPTGIAFNTDGTKMFIVGNAGDAVNEYTLSTGFDVSTASYSQNFSVAAQEITPEDIAFNTDGTKMFIVGNTGDDVNEYTLSTGFDISTASYSQNFSVAAQESSPTGIAFNTDGTKMFIVGSTGDDINEYTLSTGFDVSTASYVQNFSVASQESVPSGIAFNTDGTKMFIVGSNGDDVNEYSLGYPSYTNQMTSTTLNALTDSEQITLTNSLDLAVIFNFSSGSTVPTYSGTAINYDANVLNEGAILGTDYDFDFPATDKVRITSLGSNNLKIRVV